MKNIQQKSRSNQTGTKATKNRKQLMEVVRQETAELYKTFVSYTPPKRQELVDEMRTFLPKLSRNGQKWFSNYIDAFEGEVWK